MSPIKDRLNEMLKIQNGGSTTLAQSDHADNRAKKIGKTFEKAEVIRENIEIVRSNTARANEILKNNVFKITKGLQDELDSLFRVSTTTAHKINSQVKEFENDLNKIKDDSSAEYRIKKVQYTTLKREFHEALKDSSICLEFHRNKRKELLKKSLQTAQVTANEEELEALLEENKLDVFTDNVIITTEEARQQLSDIEHRHKELLKIEKQLNEVLDLFMKVATLVDEQQESVDRVEYLAATATDFVEQGTTVLDKGAKLKKRNRKRKIYLILIGTIVILSIGLIIVVA